MHLAKRNALRCHNQQRGKICLYSLAEKNNVEAIVNCHLLQLINLYCRAQSGYSQHKHRPLVVRLYPAGIQTFCLKGAASEKKASLKVA